MTKTLQERIEAWPKSKSITFAGRTELLSLAWQVGELERGYDDIRSFRDAETERCDFWKGKHDTLQSVGVENRAFVARIEALEAALRQWEKYLLVKARNLRDKPHAYELVIAKNLTRKALNPGGDGE